MPKVAKNVPASTNSRSPATPCTPMVVIASPPITTRPATMTSAPVTRLRRQPLVQHDGRQHEAEHRRGRRLDDAAVAERHQRKAGVADEGDAEAAEERQHDAAAPADAVEVARCPSRQASGSSTTPAQKQRWKVRSAGVNPMSMPCRAATNPAAQNTRRAGAAERRRWRSECDGLDSFDLASWPGFTSRRLRGDDADESGNAPMTPRRIRASTCAHALAQRDGAFGTGRGMLRIVANQSGSETVAPRTKSSSPAPSPARSTRRRCRRICR